MNESLVRHNSKFNFSPFFFLQFRAPPSLFLSLFLFLHWSILSKLLIQGSSWWWSSFFHGLFPSGWRLLLPLLLCLPLHLHGGKSPLKDPIEAQRSSLHRSPTSKLPSPFIMARKARSSPFWPCMTRSTGDVKRVTQELFVVHWLSMCGWFHTFFSKKVGPSIRYKVTARASKKERRIGTNSWLAWGGVC